MILLAKEKNKNMMFLVHNKKNDLNKHDKICFIIFIGPKFPYATYNSFK